LNGCSKEYTDERKIKDEGKVKRNTGGVKWLKIFK
jgi:hypothetical protein